MYCKDVYYGVTKITISKGVAMVVVVRVSDCLYIVSMKNWGSTSFRHRFDANQCALSLLHAGLADCVKLHCGLYIPS